MTISVITAFEIYTNPFDLKLLIVKEIDGAKYSIFVLRGPGHNFKPLLTTQPFTEELEFAVEVVKETLESINKAVTERFADRNIFPSLVLNPDGLEIDMSMVLNPDLISRIVADLQRNGAAHTYKY